MEPISDVALRGGIAEAGFDGIVDLAEIPRINEAGRVVRIEDDIAAGDGLQMAIADIQLPTLYLLEQTNYRDVLIVAGRAIPAKKAVCIYSQARPAEVFAQE